MMRDPVTVMGRRREERNGPGDGGPAQGGAHGRRTAPEQHGTDEASAREDQPDQQQQALMHVRRRQAFREAHQERLAQRVRQRKGRDTTATTSRPNRDSSGC